MKKPEISPDFTLEDISKIREYNAERYWSIPEEEYWTEVRDSSSRMQKKLEEIRKNRLAQECANVGRAV
jgi:hypothetical protein